MPGARGARATRSVAAPTAVMMVTFCPACGAQPGRACTSVVAAGQTDLNLALKPSHQARRVAYTIATGQQAP